MATASAAGGPAGGGDGTEAMARLTRAEDEIAKLRMMLLGSDGAYPAVGTPHMPVEMRLANIEADVQGAQGAVNVVADQARAEFLSLTDKTKVELVQVATKQETAFQAVAGQIQGEGTKAQRAVEDLQGKVMGELTKLREDAKAECQKIREEAAALQTAMSQHAAAVATAQQQAAAAQGLPQAQPQASVPSQQATGAPGGVSPPWDAWQRTLDAQTGAAQPTAAAAPPVTASVGSFGTWSVDSKWASLIVKLDEEKQEGYPVWRERTSDMLSDVGARKGVKELLEWAEKQDEPIGEGEELRAQQDGGALLAPGGCVTEISRLVYKGVTMVVHDNVMKTWGKTAGTGRGLELWRLLKRENECRTPQVRASITSTWMNPGQCQSMEQLRRVMPHWKNKGKEVEGFEGLEVPDSLKKVALCNLVPPELARELNTRPELGEYRRALGHVENLIGQDRGMSFVQRYSGSKDGGPDRMQIGSLDTEQPVEGAPQEGKGPEVSSMEKCEKMMEWMVGAFQGFQGGKAGGKGGGGYTGYQPNYPPRGNFGNKGGKGEGRKAGPKGGVNGDGGGKGGTPKFEGTCNHCGKYGHRLRDCFWKTEEMRKKRSGLNTLEEDKEWDEGDDEPPERPGWMFSLVKKEPVAVSFGRYGALAAEEEEEDLQQDAPVRCLPCGPPPGLVGEPPRSQAKMRRVPKEGWRKVEKNTTTGGGVLGSLIRGGEQPTKKMDAGKRKMLAAAVKMKFQNHKCIEVMVDSGASESVVPPGLLNAKIVQGQAAKEGVKYTAADGGEIDNLGEQETGAYTEEGYEVGLKMQVADVNKPLLSVAQLVERGNEVRFHKKGGEIVNGRTGSVVRLAKKRGVYILRLWVEKTKEDLGEGFQRQEE